MMLRYLGNEKEADWIYSAIKEAIENKTKTKDLGGQATTAEFTEAVIAGIKESMSC